MSTRSRLIVGIGFIALAGCASPMTRETPNLRRAAPPLKSPPGTSALRRMAVASASLTIA